MNGSSVIRHTVRSHRAALMVMLVAVGACGLLDPVVTDIEVSGVVTDLPGTPIAGAQVALVRTTCPQTTECSTRTRGETVTGSDGRFRIVVERDQDEEDLWDLVCHQFFMEVSADGYVPIEGNYAAWRAGFCASSSAEDIRFRLDSAS